MTEKIAVTLFAILATAAVTGEPNVDRTLEFDVYLEGKKVGSHRYEFRSGESGAKQVLSVAEFKVRFLFFTAFSYRHRAEERWEDGCLVGLDARTDSDGNVTEVDGNETGEGFVVMTDDEREVLSGCVMTFAYWNPEFLEQPKLLNPQTGQYLKVDVQELEPASITLDGEDVGANSYRIRARDMDITVFYSTDNEWLALESTVKGGRILRYELS